MSTVLAVLTSLAACSAEPPGTLAVNLDRSRHEVVIRVGPVELPAAEGEAEYYHSHILTPIQDFAWPVSGWVRGTRLRLFDCAGNPLPKNRMHHVVVLHKERRELLFPIWERLLAFAQESEDLMLPRGVGMRMEQGSALGLLAAWLPVAAEPERVILELTLPYLPADANPQPVSVIPLGFDAHFAPGGGASFDLAPGRTELEQTFVLPLDGRVLVAGGHLHDYARSLTLTDLESGKTVIDVRPDVDAGGRIRGVERKVYGASGEGLKLKAARRYKVTVAYDNPTGRTISEGGMGILAALFVPQDMGKWPVLDTNDPRFKLDVEMYRRTGFLPGGAHAHRQP